MKTPLRRGFLLCVSLQWSNTPRCATVEASHAGETSDQDPVETSNTIITISSAVLLAGAANFSADNFMPFGSDDHDTDDYKDGYGDGFGPGRGSGEFDMDFPGRADADMDTDQSRNISGLVSTTAATLRPGTLCSFVARTDRCPACGKYGMPASPVAPASAPASNKADDCTR